MKQVGKLFLVPLALLLLAAALWGFLAWERPLMDVLPNENWSRVQVRGEAEEIPLEPFLEALRKNKVSRADSPSSALQAPYLELYLYSDPGTEPTLLYIQENGSVSFAAHLDTEHYRYYDGGQALYEALRALGVTVKK